MEANEDEVVDLTPEEVFEQHRSEIEERFEERGFFQRLGDMMRGFKCPHDSREYKLAILELQRLKAPIIAILLPTLFVIVLVVVTMVGSGGKEVIQVDLLSQIEDPEALEDKVEEDPPEVEPPEELPDIVVENPVVGQPTEMISEAPPTDEPVSVQPAPQDSVSITKSPVKMSGIMSSRSPGVRGAALRGGNMHGDASTEAAVMKALRWLKHTQRDDGSWAGQPVSNTGLAILSYLAHGETTASPEFGYTVERALGFLLGKLQGDGDQVHFVGEDANEYAFLIATYALCEAYSMMQNPDVKYAALKCLSRIVNNQSPTGGWDYKLNRNSSRDDLSFAGWALQALKAGKLAGLKPEGLEECIGKAVHCLETRSFKNGGFGYTANTAPTGLTATGCLAMQLLGYGARKEVAEALDYMRNWLPGFEPGKGQGGPGGVLPGANPQYYCYYAAQCKFQAGMKEGATVPDQKTWQDWNVAMKALYPKTIITIPEKIQGPDGKMHAMGYWTYKDPTCNVGGDTMGTCLCALQLMVYYRYLPTTQTSAGLADDQLEKAKAAPKKAADVAVDVDI